METDFIYWRHHTPIGVKVEEITGAENRSGSIWTAMARQVYQENGRDSYRSIDHLPNGAPILYGEKCRISLTHTDHLLAVATLPPTPEAPLDIFSERTALGIDAERADRCQVLKIRERFLSAQEQTMVSSVDLQANIIAWTTKEALYKAALTPGLDWRKEIEIISMPSIDGTLGAAQVTIDGKSIPFTVYSYSSGPYIITLVITKHTATFVKDKKG